MANINVRDYIDESYGFLSITNSNQVVVEKH